MLFEYVRWLRFSAESPLTFDLIAKVVMLASCGLLLLLAGFKVKGSSGAVLASLIGIALYLLVRGY
jgi:hypothetical protein